MNRLVPLIAVAIACMIGCRSSSTSSSASVPESYRPQGKVEHFSNGDWSTVLSAVVTPEGWVRWDILEQDDGSVRDHLFRYVGLIGVVSPDTRREMLKEPLFKTDDEKLAYWINAYNALAMFATLQKLDLHKTVFAVGGSSMTLGQIMDGKIRSAVDPRVHFALNDCTRSAPKLRGEAYEGLKVQQQLTDDGRRFLSDSYGAVRDGENARISAIFRDYSDDFLAGYEKQAGHRPTGLLQAIALYAAPVSPVIGAKGYSFMSYDRSRNSPM